jgi:hypothetical protein
MEAVRRLSEMQFPEVRQRLIQSLQVAKERWRLARGSFLGSEWCSLWEASRFEDRKLCSALQMNDETSASEMLPQYVAERLNTRLCSLGSCCSIVTQIYRDYFPGRIEQIIREADELCEHRLTVFAYPRIECGPKIPWRRDPVHGIQSGLDHRSQIRYLNFAKVGDSKIVWEPNRHQHLVTLALAYCLTREERLAEEIFNQWEDWQQENPYLCGINWASSLELAFRAWSWIWMIHLLAGSRLMTGKRITQLIRALALHADFICANLSTYFSPNTHLLGEAFGLFAIGLLFPELRSSSMYLSTGRRILLEEITKQVRADGSHAEQSTSYHRYASDFFLCAAILADRNGCQLPAAYRVQLERMLEFMIHTAWPDGKHPMIGDADGGRVVPFGVRDPNDNRSTLSTAAVYFHREDFRRQAGHFHEESLWLLGSEAMAEFAQLEPTNPEEKSKLFSEAGFAVMRSGWTSNARMLLFDAGSQGLSSCGHGHADALSVVCSAEGTKWLVDPGTFVYTASPPWRDYFRSTMAHNTLSIDGHGQAEPREPFKWSSICPSRLERWTSHHNLDYASGVHDGYTRLTKPVVHKRSVVFVKPDFWFLLDDLSGAGTHLWEFFFHFAPGIELQTEEHRCRAVNGDSHFVVIADRRITFETQLGEDRPIQGWYSEDYGQRVAAPVLTGRASSAVPVRFPWILWPNAPLDAELCAASRSSVAWVLKNSPYTDYFLFMDPAGGDSDAEAFTDAELAFFRVGRSGLVERLDMLGGSTVDWQGYPLLLADDKIEDFELTRRNHLLDIEMHPEVGFVFLGPGVTSVRINGRNSDFARNGASISIRRGN